MVHGWVYTSHHGYPLFPSLTPTLTSVFDPSNWVYDDDVDRVSDEEVPQGQGRGVSGDSVTDNMGGSDALNSSTTVPLNMEMYMPPTTQNRTRWAPQASIPPISINIWMTISHTST